MDASSSYLCISIQVCNTKKNESSMPHFTLINPINQTWRKRRYTRSIKKYKQVYTKTLKNITTTRNKMSAIFKIIILYMYLQYLHNGSALDATTLSKSIYIHAWAVQHTTSISWLSHMVSSCSLSLKKYICRERESKKRGKNQCFMG